MPKVICAWCSGSIHDGRTPGEEDSHGICFNCVKAMGLFPTEDVLELSAAQLDALPLGVIELDRDGIVRRYNVVESETSGLAPDRVIGRDFFREVAPCTTVHEFQGRFAAMTRSPTPCREELDFVFRFASGDRYAHLVFVWSPRHARLMILADLLGDPREHSRRVAATWTED
ncbi:MAG: PAS domain-containing protein [Planctomycetes bacterium]|nr:PAS domain-containing protein [Planctomycetota bacterium]